MTRKNTLRMVQTGIKQVEVDKRISLDDAAVMALLQKEIKNRLEPRAVLLALLLILVHQVHGWVYGIISQQSSIQNRKS